MEQARIYKNAGANVYMYYLDIYMLTYLSIGSGVEMDNNWGEKPPALAGASFSQERMLK